MNPPRLIAALSFLAPARTAANSRGINEAFGDLIPPFLLRPGPRFFCPAVHAAKRDVEVISSADEVGDAVAVVGREERIIHRNHAMSTERGSLGSSRGFGGTLFSPRANFCPPLFAAFHRY